MILRQNFKNVSNITENSRKEFWKFTGNSRPHRRYFEMLR